MQRNRNGRQSESHYGNGSAGIVNPRARQRAIAVGIVREDEHRDDPLAELKELLRTAGVATAGEMTQTRPQPDPDRYLGRGKLTELKREIAAADANLVAVDDELVPRQERNLEQALGVPVIDRTAVILDIFADHAHTAEGKLQVELAQLEYNLARMRGLWTHLERLGGGIGTRGPGESQIETDRRLGARPDHIPAPAPRAARAQSRGDARRAGAGRDADRRARRLHERRQVDAAERPDGRRRGVGERLFHTLDPTTRAFTHEGRRILLTDTVGFIRKLPHALVEAFKATLEETRPGRPDPARRRRLRARGGADGLHLCGGRRAG